jgi:hypothetical protein
LGSTNNELNKKKDREKERKKEKKEHEIGNKKGKGNRRVPWSSIAECDSLRLPPAERL